MPYSSKVSYSKINFNSQIDNCPKININSRKKIIKKRTSMGQWILVLILALIALACLLPLLLVIIVAFSSEASIAEKGFSLFPTEWSMKAFEYVHAFSGQIMQSYKVSIFETVAATALTLLITGMFAYGLSRECFMLRKHLTIYLLITMLFGGGILGSYLINANVYNLRNNLLVLILPSLISAWNCIIMRTFIKLNVPGALIDAAKIDGAGDAYTYFRIVLPIMLPVMAAIGFMTAIGHWNDWQTAFLYIDNPNLATLQLMLIRIEKNLNYLQQRQSSLSPEELKMLKEAPNESAQMAILLYTIGPVIVAYPFFQKYFIKGITVGAVKG